MSNLTRYNGIDIEALADEAGIKWKHAPNYSIHTVCLISPPWRRGRGNKATYVVQGMDAPVVEWMLRAAIVMKQAAELTKWKPNK